MLAVLGWRVLGLRAHTSTPGRIPLPPQAFIEAVGGADFLTMGREIFEQVHRRCGLSRPTRSSTSALDAAGWPFR